MDLKWKSQLLLAEQVSDPAAEILA